MRCNQTHIYTPPPLQIKLVLINLAGGTQHVFPFTSWPAPRAAQWKPSILVCLQFVCLNFFANLGYLACWSCSGRPMLFIPLRHNTSRPFYAPTPPNKPASDHLLLPASKKKKSRFCDFCHRFSIEAGRAAAAEDYQPVLWKQRGGLQGSQTVQL